MAELYLGSQLKPEMRGDQALVISHLWLNDSLPEGVKPISPIRSMQYFPLDISLQRFQEIQEMEAEERKITMERVYMGISGEKTTLEIVEALDQLALDQLNTQLNATTGLDALDHLLVQEKFIRRP